MIATVAPMVFPALQAVLDPSSTSSAQLSNISNAPNPLPSHDAAYRVLNGDPSAWISVVGSTLFRAGIIALGLWIVDNDDKKIVERSFAASLAIEGFVFAWQWQRGRAIPTSVQAAQNGVTGSMVTPPLAVSGTSSQLTPNTAPIAPSLSPLAH